MLAGTRNNGWHVIYLLDFIHPCASHNFLWTYFIFVEFQILETAFKKETVGLVTREQYVEKVGATICVVV